MSSMISINSSLANVVSNFEFKIIRKRKSNSRVFKFYFIIFNLKKKPASCFTKTFLFNISISFCLSFSTSVWVENVNEGDIGSLKKKPSLLLKNISCDTFIDM